MNLNVIVVLKFNFFNIAQIFLIISTTITGNQIFLIHQNVKTKYP